MKPHRWRDFIHLKFVKLRRNLPILLYTCVFHFVAKRTKNSRTKLQFRS